VSVIASNHDLTTYRGGWLLVGAVVASACTRSTPSPPVPMPAAAAATPQAERSAEYRKTPGAPISIAPMVIIDARAPSPLPSTTEAQPKHAETLNGDPNGISRESLDRAIQKAMDPIASCFGSSAQEPSVAVSFEADPSGHPSRVRVNGATPAAEHCIRDVVQGIRFPSFEGKGVPVELPLTFHRPGGTERSGAAPAAEGPKGPPLFMEP